MDIVRDPIPGLIRRIAVPFGLGMIFNTMFNVTDTFFAGRLSTDALAALSLSFPMFFLVFGPGIGIQTGASALISNAIGRGDDDAAIAFQLQAITLGVIVAGVIGVALFVGLPGLFRLYGADGEVLAGGLRYMRVIAAFAVPIVLAQVVNAGLVARGDTKAFRNILFAMAVANVALDPLLMFGLRVAGVQVVPMLREAGTALATGLLYTLAVVYLVLRGRKAGCYAGATFRSFLPERSRMRDLIEQSAPATLDFLIMTLGAFVINYFVAEYGRDAIAAYGAGLRIEQIALLPMFGISTALATLVGQNNGAGRIDRVHESFSTALRISIVVAVLILTPVIAASGVLLRVFTDTGEVVRIGRRYLYIQAVTYFSYTLMALSGAVLRGIKRPAMIMWVGAYRQVAAPLVVFPLFASILGWGLDGVFWGIAIVNWSAAIWTWFYARHRLSKIESESTNEAPVTPPE